MNILARKPNRRRAISYFGIAGIFTSFVIALAAYLSVLTPTGKATPGCATEWWVVALAQADLEAAFNVLTQAQSDWYMCEYNTPGNCGTEEWLIVFAQADFDAATATLHQAEADALACEYGY